MRSRRATATILVGAVAALVRLPSVYSRPFWEDEVASARIVVQPTFLGMLHRVGVTESTPPLWYALAWLVHQAGPSPQSERLLSVLFGGLVAAATLELARRFVALPLAITAGLMTAVGSEFVLHGAELRAYELFALLTVLLGLCVVSLLDAPSRRLDIALGVVVAAGCLTHYFFAFSVAALLAWLWVDPATRAIRRRATLAVVSGGVFAALWLPVMITQYSAGRFRWIGAFSLRDVVAVPLRLFTYSFSEVPVGPVLSVSMLALVSFGGVQLARRSAAGRLVFVLALAPIAIAALAWGGGMPIFDLRNLIGVGGFVAVLTVAALDALPFRVHVASAVTVVGALALSLATSNADRIPAYDAMAKSLVRSGWNASKPILVYGDPYRYRLPLEWYLPRRPVLDMSRSLDGTCAEVFVVTPAGHVERERLHARSLRRRTLLVDPQHRPQCVRLPATVSRRAA